MRTKKVVHFEEEIPTQFVQPSELVHCLKPFLTLTKVFGLPTFTILPSNVVSKSSLLTALSIWNFTLLFNQAFLLGIKAYKGRSDWVSAGPDLILRLHLIFVHLWSFLFSQKLSRLLKETSSIESRLKMYKMEDGECHLHRKCLLTTVVYTILSALFIIKGFLIELFVNAPSFGDNFERVSQLNCDLASTIFYNPTLSSLHCLATTAASGFAWLFPDFILVLSSIVLAEYFARLNRGIRGMEPGRFTSIEIDLVREHHGIIAKLVSKFDDTVTFLNLINVIFNSAYLLIGGYSLISIYPSLSYSNSRTRRKPNTLLTYALNLLSKMIISGLKSLLGLLAASFLHLRAHETIAEVRSWPVAREFQDFSVNNGRATVIHAFLAQLAGPNIGLTMGKVTVLTLKLLLILFVGITGFLVFSKVTLSSCASRIRL